ncbi:hypothetical protein [Novipirellula artificiosorum]|uniref:Uncharacterized protein n=1 Tax=Novipirellula artificiosorum TaxID=2528016 RepID=A0A5C6CY81_9BACT|nr:hypothetical protein [Novipirellula artificiosorum]TWU28875.1 hypothetical protein Poly41_68260 [Novipirellula artificiosorum]
MLVVDPIKVVQHEVLTSKQCDEGLQLVMPDLSDEVSQEGEYSLESTQIRLPLDSRKWTIDSDATQIEDIVTLHQVTTGPKNEVTQRLAMVAAELMELGRVER